MSPPPLSRIPQQDKKKLYHSSSSAMLAPPSDAPINNPSTVTTDDASKEVISSAQIAGFSTERQVTIDCQSHSGSVAFDSRQRKYLFCILAVNFACYITYAVIAPFFTVVAQDKGLDQFHIDLIFSGYALASVLVSPLLGRLTPLVGCKPMLLFCLGLNGTANVVFGFLDRIADADFFFAASLALRMVEAVGTIAIVTASYTYVIRLFPDNVGYVFGLTETAVGMGLCLGPALGGPLFVLGGYELPFLVFGGIEFISIPVCAVLLDNLNDKSESGDKATVSCPPLSSPDLQETKSQPVTYLQLLAIPRVQFLCVLIVLASCCQNFTLPTLQAHLKSLGLSEVVGSMEFFLYSFFYMASTPFVGILSDRLGSHYFVTILLGHLVGVFGFLLVGPASFLTFLQSSLTFTSIGLVLMGFSIAFALVPTFEAILHSAQKRGVPNDLHTYGKVSGVWTCMFSFGEMIGPQMSGSLMEYLGFRTASTLFALMSACFLPPLLLFVLIDRLKDTRISTPACLDGDDARALVDHDELLTA